MNDLNSLQVQVLYEARKTLRSDVMAITKSSLSENKLNHLVIAPGTVGPEQFSTEIVQETCCLKVMKSKEVLAIRNYSRTDDDVFCPLMQAENLEGYLGVPLILNGSCFGALEAMTKRPKNWTEADQQMACEFAKVLESLLEGDQSTAAADPKVRRLN